MSGRTAFQTEGQYVQRPRGRTMPGLLEETVRGPIGWRGVSHSESRRKQGQGGVVLDLCW